MKALESFRTGALTFVLLIGMTAPVLAGFTYSEAEGEVTITGHSNPVGEIVIPASIDDLPVVAIADVAFTDAVSMTGISIPASVTRIGDWAFFGCTGITTLTLPANLSDIGINAFRGCTSLEQVMVESHLNSLGDNAFRNCSTLGAVFFLADAPSTVGLDIFEGSPSVSVYRLYGTDGWSDSFAGKPVYLWDPTSALVYTIAIPDSISIIDHLGTGGIVSISDTISGMPVVSIGTDAFRDRTDLTGIELPESIVSIGTNSFDGCTHLAGITLPTNVTSIADFAFRNCSSMTGAYFHGDAPEIGSSIFTDSPQVTVYRLAAAGGWPAFGDLWAGRPTDVWDLDTVATPVFSPNGGAFPGASVEVTISSATAGATLRYTTDGAPPTETSPEVVGGVVEVPLPATLKAKSWKEGVAPSATRSAEFLVSTAPSLFDYSIVGETIRIDKYLGVAGPVVIPSFIENRPVTVIADYAFRDKSYLTSVTIPDSVTSIGIYTFSGCSSLTSVNIPDSVTSIGAMAFYRCSSLTSVNIPNSVTSIGWYAFYDCSSLTSVTIPDSVTSIGIYTFSGCSSLTSVTIPDSVISIGDWAFQNCSGLTSVNIPGSVTSIGDRAFSECSSLTSVTIPDSVTSIGDWAFSECSNLQFIDVSGENLFYSSSEEGVLFDKHQYALIQYPARRTATHYVVPPTVILIGDYAFSRCSSLTNVTIPDSVISIGDRAFSECSSLTSVTIPDSVSSIGDWAFYGCSSLTSVTIPDSVTSIGDYAFYGCYSLTSVTIPDSVTSIGNGTFRDCTSLTSVTIGNSVTSIGWYAFYRCSSLTSVTIGNSVTSIGDHAFYGCSSLTSVYFFGSPPTIGSYGFSNTSATLYYLPAHADQWPDTYADRPAVFWNPTFVDVVLDGGEFSCTVTGTIDIPVALEAAPHPENGPWTRLETTTLTDGQLTFSDPDAGNHPARFYRIIGP